jgi:MFS family permease
MTSEANKQPFLAFSFPEFRLYMGASFLFTVAFLIQEVIIGYELYQVTGDPLAIGLLGLAHALPFIGLSLVGGHLADLFSKKKMLLISMAGMMACSLLLYLASRQLSSGNHSLSLQIAIYGVVFVTGACYAFYSPTASALKAFLVPKSAYENAATWSSTAWQVGTVTGPGVSGFIYAQAGFSNTILVVIALMGLAWLFLLQIRDRGAAPAGEGKIREKIREGIRFVRNTRMLLYAISLDLFSVLFGGVIAILPVFAEDILKVGPEGLGMLRAAPSAGALLTLLLLSTLSITRNAWRVLLLNVAGFGISTLVFALSENFLLSAVALFFTGAFDAVSVVVRQTILLMLTPDDMRGRVGSVNGIFISASNELGAFESGLAASLMGAVHSVVFGGAMTLLVVTWVWWKSRDLLSFDLREGAGT